MFNSSLIHYSKKISGNSFSLDNPIVLAYRTVHKDVIDLALDMWQTAGGDDCLFVEYFDHVFPPGFIRRDLQRAKSVLYDLKDIAESDIVRFSLSPIYTYVMFHLLEDTIRLWRETNINTLSKELVQYLISNKASRADRHYIVSWFTDGDTCVYDFLEIYNGDYTSLDMIEMIASMYLYDPNGDIELQMLGVTIDEFFDLLPNDLRDECIAKFESESHTIKNTGGFMNVDFFISHASEDKKTVAEPLAIALQSMGATVWLDKFELTVGDSLRESLDYGLRSAKHGIVILSPIYFEKFWTKKELNALFAKSATSSKAILPIRHGISADEIAEYSPLLADIFSLSTENNTIENIAEDIMRVLQ